MAYELKPGYGSLFRVKQKASDSHADYNGSIKLQDGTECWLNGWIKKTDNGSFLSLSVKPKEKQQEPNFNPPDDGLGF